MIGRSRTVALVATAAAAALAALLPGASPAGAIDLSPRTVYEAWRSGSSVQVSGTFQPIVGNFAGDRSDDILWYAPGSGADSLWIGSTSRTFTKVPVTINGTYTPLVGDFAGDGFEDILWYAPGTAPDALWTSVARAGRYFDTWNLRIDGTYRPVVLDGHLEYAAEVIGDTGLPAKDSIVWYRPGPAADYLWVWDPAPPTTAGVHSSSPLSIPGSPQLIPYEDGGDVFQDLLAYTPGAGADAIYTWDTGALIPTPITVNGTYTPVVLGPGYRDSILWYGPGSAPDKAWANLPCCGLTPRTTDAIGGARVLPVWSYSGYGYVYDPNGPDKGLVDGTIVTSLDPDVGAGAQPVTGDFDGDRAVDAFFYRPGSGRDLVGYSATPGGF